MLFIHPDCVNVSYLQRCLPSLQYNGTRLHFTCALCQKILLTNSTAMSLSRHHDLVKHFNPHTHNHCCEQHDISHFLTQQKNMHLSPLVTAQLARMPPIMFTSHLLSVIASHPESETSLLPPDTLKVGRKKIGPA